MIRDYIKNNKQKISRWILIASYILLACTVVKAAVYTVNSIKTSYVIKQALKNSEHDEKKINEALAKFTNRAEELKKNSLFAPPPPKPSPPSCNGVIGDKVIINGKLYGVGDKVAGAEILSVTPLEVTIKWEGSEKKLYPFPQNGAVSPPSPVSVPKAPEKNGKQKAANNVNAAKTTEAAAVENVVPPQASSEGPMTRERFMNMTEEQRRQYFEQLQKSGRIRVMESRPGQGPEGVMVQPADPGR